MDKIDELIEKFGDLYENKNDDLVIRSLGDLYFLASSISFSGDHICTVGEYKERLHKQQLIKLIESACTNDAASIANVIIRNGWVKK